MSRCFPYPPPGFARNGAGDEALIELIKRDEKSIRKERKEEKKRKKRESRKSREEGENSEKKHHHKRKHGEATSKEGYDTNKDQQKKQKVDSKDTDRSNLTEEHGRPVSSQNSTDSTLNSCNGQETPPGLAMEGRQRSGGIIRIQSPLQRQKDPDVIPSKEQPRSFAPERILNNVPSTSEMCGTVPRNTVDRGALLKPYSTSSFKSPESATVGRKVTNISMIASQMSRTINWKSEEKGRRDSLAASELHGTLREASPAGICLTSNVNGRESTPGKANSNTSLVASRNGVALPQAGSSRVSLSSSIKSRGSSAPGKPNKNVSVAASEFFKNSNVARKGQEKSSEVVKGISNGSVASLQLCGAVSQSSGDRTRNTHTAEDRTEQEQSSIPGRIVSKLSFSASKKPKSADKFSEIRTKPEELCSTSQESLDTSALNLRKEGRDSLFAFDAPAETPAERAEAKCATSSQTARRPSSSEVKYANLVENWVPLTLQDLYDNHIDEQEWLIRKKLEDKMGGAKEESKAESACLTLSHGDSQGPWPRVCFLPEVDLYALPYTIPY